MYESNFPASFCTRTGWTMDSFRVVVKHPHDNFAIGAAPARAHVMHMPLRALVHEARPDDGSTSLHACFINFFALSVYT